MRGAIPFLAKMNPQRIPLVLEENIPFRAHFVESSLEKAKMVQDLQFRVEGQVQNLQLNGDIYFKNVES